MYNLADYKKAKRRKGVYKKLRNILLGTLTIMTVILVLNVKTLISSNKEEKVELPVPETEITQTLDNPTKVLPTNQEIANAVIELNGTYKALGDAIQIDYIFNDDTIEFVINDYSINYNDYENTQGLHILKSYIQGRFVTLYNLVKEYTIGREVIINYFIQGRDIATMYNNPETFVFKS